MPSNGGNITFGIDFNVNKSGLNDLKKSLQEIQKMTTKDLIGNLGSDQAKKALEEAKRSAAEVEQALKKAYNPTLGTTNITKFNQELKNSGTNLNQVYQRFSKIGTAGQTAFTNLASNVLTTNVKLKETNSLLDSMGKTMINTVKWGIASSVMNTFTGSVQNAFNYVKALDSSLTDIRIVTGDSRDQMDRFAKSANQAAQSLGRQTKEYTNAALAFYQQGLGDEEVAARTETTLKAANITGADVASMANQLTAVWNGFQIQGEKTNEVVSKLAAVADTSASNMSELATAMSKSASIANNMGVNVDQLGAQIATIIATTRQAPQTVGNALKTIYARINDIKAGTDDAEVSLGNYTGKMAQLGINVLDQNGQLRDTGQVMEEIGQRWGSMTKEQQVYLAQTMAGQRQMNNLIALFDNWDMYTKELNISLEAQGTLDQKNARYMESLAAHTKEFESAQEGLIQAFANGDSFKGFIDLGTEAVRMMTSLVEGIGGGGNAILALGSIATSVFSGVIGKEINSLVTNFQNAKFNAEQLNQVIANTKSVAAIEGISDNKAVQAMIDAQTETQKYYSIMSEAEINHQNDLIKQLGLAQQNRIVWEQNTKAAQEYAKAISGSNNIDILKQDSQGFDELGYYIQRVQDQIEATEESLKQLRDTGTEEATDGLIANMKQLLTVSDDTSESAKRLSKAIENIEKSSWPTQDALKQLKSASQSFINETKTSVGNLSTIFNDGGQAVSSYRSKVETLRETINTNNNSFRQLFDVQAAVQMVGAIGQVTAGLNSLLNINNILKDDGLNSWEKFTRIISNIGMSLPMLLSSFSKLNETLHIAGTLQTLLGKETVLSFQGMMIAEEAQTATKEANTLAIQANTAAAKANALTKKYEQAVAMGQIDIDELEIAMYTAQTEAAHANALAEAAAAKASKLKTAADAQQAAATNLVTQAQNRLNAAMAENPITTILIGAVAVTAALAAVFYAMEKIAPSAENAKKSLEDALGTYNEETEKLSSLEDELKSVQDRIKEIEKLGPVTLTDKQELINLKAQNAELQTQIQLQEKLVQKSSREVARKANTAVEAKSFDVDTTPFNNGQDFFGNASERYSWGRASIDVSRVSDISNLDISLEDDAQKFLKWQEQMQALVQEANQKIKQAQQSNDKELQQEYTFVRDNLVKDRTGYEQVWKAAHEQALQDLQASHENNVKYIKALQENNQDGIFDDAIEYYQSLQKKYYQLAGTWEETVTSIMNTALSDGQGDILKNAIEEAGGEIDLQNIKQLLGEDAFSTIQIGAKSLGISLEDLISAFINLQEVEENVVETTQSIAEAFAESKGNLTLFSNFRADITSEKDIKQDDLEEYFNLLTNIQNKYPKLRSEVQLLKQTWLSSTDEYADALEKVNDQLSNQTIEDAQRSAEEASQKINQIIDNITNEDGVLIEIDDSSLLQFESSLNDFIQAEHTIDVEVSSNAEREVAAIQEQFDNISSAASKIGEDFVIAASDIASINNVFPGIIQGMQRLEDGSYQLKDTIVQNAIGMATAEVAAEASSVQERVAAQASLLREKAETYRAMAKAARTLASSEVQSSTESGKAQATIADGVKHIKEIDSQLAANKEISDMADVADSSNDNAQAMALNWGSGSEASASSVYNFAKNAIDNAHQIAVAMAGATSIPPSEVGAAIPPGGINSSGSYQGTAGTKTALSSGMSGDSGGLGEDFFNSEEALLAAAEQWEAAASALDAAANKMDGSVAQLGATAENVAQGIQNVANGKGYSGGSGKGGGGGGGGKDKTKSAEEIDKLKLKDQDVDKYHQIERAIKRIDDYLDAMSGYEEKAIRGAKSDTIDKQVDALQQQKALYEQKIQMMQADLQLQQADLQLLGVQFDEQGNIINYTALMSAYQAQYNALLEQAKLLTGDAQENKLKQASNLKQQLESLKSQMGAYESLQDKIMDAGSAIRDIIDKEEELRIKQFKIEIDTQLEFADAKRDWNEFKKEVIDKIKDDDFLGQARARVQDFFSYYDDQGNGIIQKLTEHVNRTREEAEIIENGGTSSIYGKNQAQALEDLKHYTDELMQNLKDVQEIAEDIHDLYLDTIDKAQDAFDEQIDQYEQIDSIIEHDMNLLELLSPENNEEALAHYYDKRAQNHNQEIDFYRKEADMWKAQLENAEEGTEEWKKFRDNWEASISDLNSAVEAAVENLISKYENTISKIVKETKNQIMGGDWQKAMDEWDRAKWNDDRYLDMGSRATGVLDFMDKVNEAMNGQSPKVQKQLNEFLEKEVGYLNEIPNLRQIDLDIAYKKLEVLQKQMALEDAQEAKTRMRLRRDSQGNYTYQYVADEDQIATKQQQLRDTLEELRQLAKVDVSETMDEVQEKLDEFFEHAQELSQTYYDDQDLLQQKLLELQTAYFGEEGYITLLGIDYNTMQNELLTATGAQFSVLLGQMGNDLQAFLGLDGENAKDKAVWTSILALLSPDGGKIPTLFDAFVKDVYQKNFALMSEQNQNLLFGSETGLNPSWNTALGNMAENYAALTGNVVIPCMQAMIDANAVYGNDLRALQQIAGVSFGSIAQGIDQDIAYTQTLKQANDYLVDSMESQINAIASVNAQISALCGQYRNAEAAAIDAANAALKFWFAANGQTIGDVYSGGTPHATAAVPSAPVNNTPTSASSSGGSSTKKSGGSNPPPNQTPSVSRQATFAENQLARYLGTPQSQGGAGYDNNAQIADQLRRTADDLDRHNVYAQGNLRTWDYKPKAFATGGYTGDWSDSEGGKLAILHQKELVLNPEDTINTLNAVKIASGMMERIAGLNSSVLDNLIANRGLSNIETGGAVDSSSHQVINIQADFPNANSADEIRQAFNNLINIASQRASGNRRTY